ncbi:MAG: GAF domain-containing protein [Bacteroidota bacterium]
MESSVSVNTLTKRERYEEIIPQIESLIAGEPDTVANLANITAALKLALGARASWLGFYLLKRGELVVGPFQGKPACVRIALGKGVCGASAEQRKTLIVPDVNKFPGHIFCDPDSKSEIVVPLICDGELLGVLDVDSSSLNAFDEVDQQHLERIADTISHGMKSWI